MTAEHRGYKAEEAGLFRAGLLRTPPRSRWVRGFKGGYWIEFAKPPRVISARTASPTFFCLIFLVPCPT